MSLAEESRKPGGAETGTIAARLIAWYDRHHRELPWRMKPAELAAGRRPDPYRVWLSEIMLQQTTVEAVKPYFRAFTERWPDVKALAAADPDDIMKAWAGLGYYSRARNLRKCAELVAGTLGGQFPDAVEGLARLPGIGPYTAAAIAAIAFDRSAAVVDGNVERVIARLAAIEVPLPQAKPAIRAAVEALVPAERPGDFAQAMMDLGATICTPRRPSCMICPLNADCRALGLGDPERLPLREAKAEKPGRIGAAFVAVRNDVAVLLRKRKEDGLLGGMAEVPGSAWTARRDGETETGAAPFPADWKLAGRVQHVFTHFALDLTVWRADVAELTVPQGWWWSNDIRAEALPTVMKKALEVAIPGVTKKGSRAVGQ